ncbi:MAG TPA: ATP-binding protein [Hymenobacter sp.]|nr:ATP-binding protein [Hymenobacter sp.]
MITRALATKLQQLATGFPILTVTGPRQSGKSTLVQAVFPELPYVLLEDPDVRLLAQQDPRRFLATYPNGAIFDEVQRVPELFSYLQGVVDRQPAPAAPYVLTGSQNFLLLEGIGQTLAGRTAVLRLLPLSYSELAAANQLPTNVDDLLLRGGYPRLSNPALTPADFYPSYIQTYLERDVRSLQAIQDLSAFVRFLKLCAGRIGSTLNLTSLASDCGVAVNTAKSWISVLEASYVLYLLPPHYQNFSKRLIKSPKLYFYDTGLACSLLGIQQVQQLESHYLRGGLFENLVITEVLKHYYNQGQPAPIYFWQDKTGREVDLLIEHPTGLLPLEIKAGMTLNQEYFKQLTYWNGLSGQPAERAYVLYAGPVSMPTKQGTFMRLAELDRLLTNGAL